MNEIELEIDRGAVRCYLVVYSSLWCFWVLFVFCYPLILHAVYGVVLFFTFGLWYFHLRTNNLRYRLDGSALQVDGGILFPYRKLIPLERVTEIASYQGPLLLCFGI